MANTRVKVPRTVLIERIQEKIDSETKAHEEELAAHEKAVEDFLTKLPSEIEKRAKEISKEISELKSDEAKNGFVESVGTYEKSASIRLSIPLRVPRFEGKTYDGRVYRGYQSRTDFKGYVESMEKAKRVLEAATEDLISVAATDEYANYL